MPNSNYDMPIRNCQAIKKGQKALGWSNRRVHALSCIMCNQGKIVKKQRSKEYFFSSYFRSELNFCAATLTIKYLETPFLHSLAL